MTCRRSRGADDTRPAGGHEPARSLRTGGFVRSAHSERSGCTTATRAASSRRPQSASPPRLTHMEASTTRHPAGARKATKRARGKKSARGAASPAAPRSRRTTTSPAKVPGSGRLTGPLPPHDDAAFIERLGLLAEESGMPRMAGRVLGWLLICEEPRQSFGEIVEALGASKGSISAMTRILQQLGLIERVTQGGDRRDFFQL